MWPAHRRSPSPKAEKPQATVESGSKAAKPRADEASTPPQSPRPAALRWEAGRDGANVEHALRDKSAKWSFKKGDDPSKMGSAKESTRHRIATLRSALIMLPARSPPPSSDAQRRSDEPSSAKAAASASEGTPPQSPRRGTCLLMRFCPPQHAILAGVRSR